MDFKQVFENNLGKTFNIWLNKMFAHLIDINKEEEDNLKDLKDKMVDDFIKYIDEKNKKRFDKSKSLNESSEIIKIPKKEKLFKLKVVKQMVEENPFLKSKFDKLATPTKDGGPDERFGYHWGEVIHNILFNKYIKSDPTMLDKYMTLKRNIDTEDIKLKNDKKEKAQQNAVDGNTTTITNIKEMDTASTFPNGSFPVSPKAFASDDNEWRFKNDTKINGSKIVDDVNTKKYKIKLK